MANLVNHRSVPKCLVLAASRPKKELNLLNAFCEFLISDNSPCRTVMGISRTVQLGGQYEKFTTLHLDKCDVIPIMSIIFRISAIYLSKTQVVFCNILIKLGVSVSVLTLTANLYPLVSLSVQ